MDGEVFTSRPVSIKAFNWPSTTPLCAPPPHAHVPVPKILGALNLFLFLPKFSNFSQSRNKFNNQPPKSTVSRSRRKDPSNKRMVDLHSFSCSK
ncbi:hypothetical protein GBA52_012224 [Prunus armeniaca]|nr:hypothetical protein GBA52_012224 [Prunus armeniaca]